MPHKSAISASDPQAVEKLTAKLQKCRERHELMKGVNAHWRNTGSCVYAPGLSHTQALQLDAKLADPQYPWDKVPFSDYELKNNYQEIKRLEKRIAEITKNHIIGFAGWKFIGGYANANTELNRLQLFFDNKPDKHTHNALRHAGFVYSHTNGAYQRQLNEKAIYAAGRLGFIQPTDGRAVREHQPRYPAKNDQAR